MESHWVYCPLCNGKTRLKLLPETTLQNFPLFCPKCKQETIIHAQNLRIRIVPQDKEE